MSRQRSKHPCARERNRHCVTGHVRTRMIAGEPKIGTEKAVKACDAEQMALGFWAPIHLLMQATDSGMSAGEAMARIRAHVLAFAQRHARSCDG